MSDYKREYWTPSLLRDAARLLQDAADNLHVSYPYSERRPNPHTLVAVEGMIKAAIKCIEHAQPSEAASAALKGGEND